jgi:hypothetical protein
MSSSSRSSAGERKVAVAETWSLLAEQAPCGRKTALLETECHAAIRRPGRGSYRYVLTLDCWRSASLTLVIAQAYDLKRRNSQTPEVIIALEDSRFVPPARRLRKARSPRRRVLFQPVSVLRNLSTDRIQVALALPDSPALRAEWNRHRPHPPGLRLHIAIGQVGGNRRDAGAKRAKHYITLVDSYGRGPDRPSAPGDNLVDQCVFIF